MRRPVVQRRLAWLALALGLVAAGWALAVTAGFPVGQSAATRPPGKPVQPDSASPTGLAAAPTGIPAKAAATVIPTFIPPAPTVAVPWQIPKRPNWRFGAVDRLSDLISFDVAALHAGWFLSGAGGSAPLPGVELVYLVEVRGDTFSPTPERLSQWVASSPGATWQVGNEPDVSWQSNCTPAEYAGLYYRLYQLIKTADPAARVAPGAVSQPTPLRLSYLDAVLFEYWSLYGQAMPVDVWAIHNAVVREEEGEWGVGIPPGLVGPSGRLVEVQDNDRLDLFEQQIGDFRAWMLERGYRDRPLIITEFGILMPFVHGYDTQRVAAFMTGAYDWLLSAKDPETGCPADGDRLVQRWAWYSVAATDYPTGNLFDPASRQMTPLGQAFADYVLRQ